MTRRAGRQVTVSSEAGHVERTRPFGAAAVSWRIESPPGATTETDPTP